MNSILSKIYRGDIHPTEDIDHHKIYPSDNQKNRYDYIMQKLSDEDQKQFIEFINCEMEDQSYYAECAYKQGVKLGMQLMCEIVNLELDNETARKEK